MEKDPQEHWDDPVVDVDNKSRELFGNFTSLSVSGSALFHNVTVPFVGRDGGGDDGGDYRGEENDKEEESKIEEAGNSEFAKEDKENLQKQEELINQEQKLPLAVTLSWDFENTESVDSVSTSVAKSLNNSITGNISQTGGGPAENWGMDKGIVFLTRFFGKNYPFINFTTTSKVGLGSLSFQHYHNHNGGYPSYPSYNVKLQINKGDSWTDIGSSFVAGPETNGNITVIDLRGQYLNPGKYQIRWIPFGLTSGSDTSTEYFAIDSVVLKIEESESTLSWDFENTESVDSVSTSVAKSLNNSITGNILQTGGGPAENWGIDKGIVFLTRFFGKNYPFINFTTTSKVGLGSLSFQHYHNHNGGYPSYPCYNVKLQINKGDSWTDIGSSFVAGPETFGNITVIDLGGQCLNPGTYQIRWIPFGLSGSDTSTEYFAIDSVVLKIEESGSTLSWDFENTKNEDSVSTSVAKSLNNSITGNISQTGGGPAENWGIDKGIVFLTRFFGKNYPFINFTTTSKVGLGSLSFQHYHNHNGGYPSYPSYNVKLQINKGDSWTDIGSSFVASPETNGNITVIDLGGQYLNPGTYQIRWIPFGLTSGSDTSTEYFAIDSVVLKIEEGGTSEFAKEDKQSLQEQEELINEKQELPLAVTLSWDFKNTESVDSVSTSVAKSLNNSIIGNISQTGGGPAENWGMDKGIVFLTRFFGKNYPFINFTTTSKVGLGSLSFLHYHNHNGGYPSYPSYNVKLQINKGDSWTDIGSSFVASPETYGNFTVIDLGAQYLNPGTYQIRWIPFGLASGFDTNTEYFVINAITFSMTAFN